MDVDDEVDEMSLLIDGEARMESIDKLKLSLPSEIKNSEGLNTIKDPLAKGSSVEMSKLFKQFERNMLDDGDDLLFDGNEDNLLLNEDENLLNNSQSLLNESKEGLK